MSATIRSSRTGGVPSRRAVLGKFAVFLSAVCFALVLGPAPAYPQDRPLDAPRAGGIVGERFDGFAFLRDPNASAEVRALVAQANDQRRKLYRQRAAEQGTSVDSVGKIYAAKIIGAAPAGTWSLKQDGTEVRK